MEESSGCPVWFGHRHRGHPEDSWGGRSERGEDFYLATREDIDLATREDFFMATDTGAPLAAEDPSTPACSWVLAQLPCRRGVGPQARTVTGTGARLAAGRTLAGSAGRARSAQA